MEAEIFFVLQLKLVSWACLIVSGLKFTFQWVAPLCILSESLLRLFADVWMYCITENENKDYHLQITLH